MPLTFDQFQATAKHVDDIQAIIGSDLGYPRDTAGVVYTADLHIFDYGAKASPRYCLQIYGDEWSSDNLSELERRLFDWAVFEFGSAD